MKTFSVIKRIYIAFINPVRLTASLALCISLFALPSQAATWICGNENWNTNYWNYTCWDLWDYPDVGEDVYLVDTIYAWEKTVNYVNPSYNPVLGRLYIESTGGNVTTLNIDQDILTTTATNVGINSGGQGAVTQDGGTHETGGLLLGYESGSVGSYELGGSGSLTVQGDETLGYRGNAYFTQTGGTHTVTGKLTLGLQPSNTSWGEYNLSGGSLTVSNEELGRRGRGDFFQTGGSHTVTNDFTVGFLQRGRYVLDAGTLTVGTERIGYFNPGFFEQNGGTHVADTIIVEADPSAYGEFSMNGGTLSANTITNNGDFNYTGGSITADITNTANFNLKGNGTRTIDGNITNEAGGTVTVTNTIATYTGAFVNRGAYISDPSTSNFSDLEVSASGYLTGGAGDIFSISGDFINQSSEQDLWDTVNAYLGFVTGDDGSHDVYISGLDLGISLAGYTDNFAWDTLSISTGNSLTFFDGNAVAGGALYVSTLLGVDFTNMQVNNIFGVNGLNIYYDTLDEDSAYLGGFTYDLMGGGQLIPLNKPVVPIPASVWLFGSGLIGLIGVARRKAHI